MKDKDTEISELHDPFAGYDDHPIELAWMGELSGEHIVRLVVDDNRWAAHSVNARYQRSALAAIRNYVTITLPSAHLIICPAGMITFGAAHTPAALTGRLAEVDWGTGPAVMLGVDGTVGDGKQRGDHTPLQTYMRIDAHATSPDPTSMILKRYPASAETASLVGWQFAREDPRVIDDEPRVQQIASLRIAALVCHESAAFAGRSIANRGAALDDVAHHLEHAIADADCVAMAIHWLQGHDGNTFMNARNRLAERHTVIPSMFAPRTELVAVAERFSPVGEVPVATLLVSDSR